jgi:Phage protein Gp138 N-terminal domain
MGTVGARDGGRLSAPYGATLAERNATSISRWDSILKSFGRNLHVALPCIVASFDSIKQTVSVKPALTEIGYVSGLRTTQWKNLILVDIPIVLPGSDEYAMTFPIIPGNECLVLFADVAIDSWFQSSGQNNQIEERRHSLSDGFALFRPRSLPNVLPNYSTTSAQLRTRDGTVVVDIAAHQITVTAPTVQVSATTATVNASGTATVAGATVNVTGSTTVNVSGANTTHVDGKSFLLHTHSGVVTGGSLSGPVA